VTPRRRRHGGGGMRALGLVLLALASCGLAWAAGLVWFVAGIPREEPPATGTSVVHTDAAVVLTGGSRRLATGLVLLASGLTDRLFVSGVYDGVEVRELLSAWTSAPDDLAKRVELGYAADSTIGNAEETASWARERGVRSIRLVTANYHMRRALVEFRAVMPGMEIIPHPVLPAVLPLDEWWTRRSTTTLLAGEYTKYLIADLRSRVEAAFAGSTTDGTGR